MKSVIETKQTLCVVTLCSYQATVVFNIVSNSNVDEQN